MDRIFEYYVSMLPLSERYLEYENYAFDEISGQGTLAGDDGADLKQHPIKLMFTTMGVCTRGTMRLRLNLTEYELHENDIIVILPGTIIDKAWWSHDLHIVTVYLKDHNINHPLFSNIALRFQEHLADAPWLIRYSKAEIADFLRLCDVARSVISSDDMAFPQEILTDCWHAIALYLLGGIRRGVTRKMEQQSLPRQTQLLIVFQNLVRRHYMKHREVKFYADKMCITPKYLSIIVKQASGRRATDWIRDFVILDAKAMILSGNYTMQQISDSLHFATPSFFGKFFKEAVGCSPRKFAESMIDSR